jgi:hypothetical protein
MCSGCAFVGRHLSRCRSRRVESHRNPRVHDRLWTKLGSGQSKLRWAGVGHLLFGLFDDFFDRGYFEEAVSATPTLTASATHVPACTPHMRTALPSRAAVARESSGWKRRSSRVLLLSPRPGEAELLPLHPSSPCLRRASVCRTGHAFVTLRPLFASHYWLGRAFASISASTSSPMRSSARSAGE